MLTRHSPNLPTYPDAIDTRAGQTWEQEVVFLREQVNQLRKEHYEFMRATKEYLDGLNKPGALDITLAKIQNSTIDNSTVGATTPASGAFTTLSCTGNATLGDAATDTLNVADSGIVKAADGRTYIAPQSEVFAVGFRYNKTQNPYYIGASNSATPSLIFSQTGGSQRAELTDGGGWVWQSGVWHQIGSGNLTFYADTTLGLLIQATPTANKITLRDSSGNSRIVMEGDGRLYGTALHNNAGAVTGATNQYIASGTYTPTLTNIANVAASTMRLTQWLRVGNVVHVAGIMDVDPTAGATLTNFRITLPIASAIGNTFELGGVGTGVQAAGTAYLAVAIYGHVANDAAEFAYTSNGTANHTLTFAFSYVVL